MTDDISAECVVAQSADTQEPYIIISPESKTVDVTGETFVITVSSNTEWNVSLSINHQPERSWVSVDKLNGMGDDEITVVVNQTQIDSSLTVSRSASVILTNENEGLREECEITQDIIDLNPENTTIYYTSSDGNIVTPYISPGDWVAPISNTYENGVGVMVFSGTTIRIGSAAFSRSNIETIVLPDNITVIDKYAFEYSDLKEVINSEHIRYIRERAFNYCKITHFEAEACQIEASGFANCTGLTSVSIGVTNQNCGYDDRNYIYQIGEYAFLNCTGLKTVKLGYNTDSIHRQSSMPSYPHIYRYGLRIGQYGFKYCDIDNLYLYGAVDAYYGGGLNNTTLHTVHQSPYGKLWWNGSGETIIKDLPEEPCWTPEHCEYVIRP